MARGLQLLEVRLALRDFGLDRPEHLAWRRVAEKGKRFGTVDQPGPGDLERTSGLVDQFPHRPVAEARGRFPGCRFASVQFVWRHGRAGRIAEQVLGRDGLS